MQSVSMLAHPETSELHPVKSLAQQQMALMRNMQRLPDVSKMLINKGKNPDIQHAQPYTAMIEIFNHPHVSFSM